MKRKGQFFFASKDNAGKDVDIYSYSSKERVISDCDKSLKRLGTDYIDLYQIHWPDPTTPVSETMEALEILIKKGKIRAGAVCNYSVELMAEADKTLHNCLKPGSIQHGKQGNRKRYCTLLHRK